LDSSSAIFSISAMIYSIRLELLIGSVRNPAAIALPVP